MRVVAIDGPAGTGKSTVARAVAERLRLAHLDTGAMYRAVTWSVLDQGGAPEDEAAVLDALGSARFTFEDERALVDGRDITAAIRSPAVTAAVSSVSSHPKLRAELVARQRAWAQAHGGGVLEGRDIGSVVFPDAELKVFLTASPEVRAARRAAESGGPVAEVAADLARRDRADSSRAESPLQEAEGAVVLDTSDLASDEVVARVVALLDDLQGEPGELRPGDRGRARRGG
ncbi:MAG: (d)CMP kinase [Acidimicrobiia bacterium]|nr:(d)CMP kinase [Acidimicrobiia bacterium]